MLMSHNKQSKFVFTLVRFNFVTELNLNFRRASLGLFDEKFTEFPGGFKSKICEQMSVKDRQRKSGTIIR